YIGGQWVPPVKGEYFENPSPVTGEVFTEVARSTAEDIEKALDAAHAAAPDWGKTSVAERAVILNRIADRIEENLELLAVAETWDNGKPIRECLNADLPLAADHFRYFAGAIRAQEGTLSQIDDDTVAYHFHEPLGVVGQIIPWNFPILMATWKLAPALAAGNAVVLKPAEQTPASILVLVGLIGDLLPDGVLNIVNGFGAEAGKPLASNPRIKKIAFTGETTTGRLIMQYASQNLIPVTLELGGKSPNIFFDDVAAHNDAFYDKALEGFAMFSLNQGEVCTCPSRALVQEGIYDSFVADGIARVEATTQRDPLDTDTMIGAQASNDQLEKILSYLDIGRQEGAKLLTGGERADLGGHLSGGYYVTPTVFEGDNSMRIFQEEIFGPVLALTRPRADVRGGPRGPCAGAPPCPRRRPGHLDRQRHPLRARLGRVEPAAEHHLPGGPRDPGRPRVGEQLPLLPRARGVRRVQVLRHRPREPPDDARPLPADQEPPGQLLGEQARLLLSRPGPRFRPTLGLRALPRAPRPLRDTRLPRGDDDAPPARCARYEPLDPARRHGERPDPDGPDPRGGSAPLGLLREDPPRGQPHPVRGGRADADHRRGAVRVQVRERPSAEPGARAADGHRLRRARRHGQRLPVLLRRDDAADRGAHRGAVGARGTGARPCR